MDGIFISYRRDDTAGYAGRLYDRLAGHFGASRVFMDVEGIEPGTDFVDAIENAVVSCQVLIVLIGDEWAVATDASGRRRLDDPNDFIRLETSVALKRNIRVVPVLVDGAAMPRNDDLPEELHALTRRQAIEISHKQWDASTGELIRTLERILGAGVAAPATAKATATTTATTAATPASAHTPAASASAAQSAPSPASAPRTEPSARPAWLLPAGIGAAVVALGGALWFGSGERHGNRMAEKSADKAPAEVPAKAAPTETITSAAEVAAKLATAEQPSASPAAPTPPAAAKARDEKPAPPAAAQPAAAARAPAPAPQVAAPQPAPAVVRPAAPPQVPTPAAPVAAVVKPQPEAQEKTLARPPPATVRERLAEAKADAAERAAEAVAAPAAATKAKVAVAPPAAVPPAAKPAAVADDGLPRQGQSWTYRATGKWRTSPTRRFRVVAQAVSGNTVTDVLSMIDPARDAESARSTGGKPAFVAWKEIGLEFSPYLAGVGEIARLQAQSGFATPDLDGQWSDWYSKASLVGRESVSVPAGTFNAYKVEVWSNRHRTGSPITVASEPVTVHYHVWYAPEVKRYVKMVRRVIAASSNELEADVFELVSR